MTGAGCGLRGRFLAGYQTTTGTRLSGGRGSFRSPLAAGVLHGAGRSFRDRGFGGAGEPAPKEQARSVGDHVGRAGHAGWKARRAPCGLRVRLIVAPRLLAPAGRALFSGAGPVRGPLASGVPSRRRWDCAAGRRRRPSSGPQSSPQPHAAGQTACAAPCPALTASAHPRPGRPPKAARLHTHMRGAKASALPKHSRTRYRPGRPPLPGEGAGSATSAPSTGVRRPRRSQATSWGTVRRTGPLVYG